MKIRHLLIILLFSLSGQMFAQTTNTNYGLPKTKDYDRWSAGITLGVSHLLGDLLEGGQNNDRFLENATLNPAIGLQGHYQITHSIGLRGRGVISKFSANDVDFLDSVTFLPILYGGAGNGKGKLFKEKYESNLLEGSLEMTYNFGNISFLNRNKNFHMVATLGLGFFNFDATVNCYVNQEMLLN
jgi:hypothetical protein